MDRHIENLAIVVSSHTIFNKIQKEEWILSTSCARHARQKGESIELIFFVKKCISIIIISDTERT